MSERRFGASSAKPEVFVCAGKVVAVSDSKPSEAVYVCDSSAAAAAACAGAPVKTRRTAQEDEAERYTRELSKVGRKENEFTTCQDIWRRSKLQKISSSGMCSNLLRNLSLPTVRTALPFHAVPQHPTHFQQDPNRYQKHSNPSESPTVMN